MAWPKLAYEHRGTGTLPPSNAANICVNWDAFCSVLNIALRKQGRGGLFFLASEF
jgi:hypothetical protein